MHKVTVIIPTRKASDVRPELARRLKEMDGSFQHLHIEEQKPIYFHPSSLVENAKNQVHTLNKARSKALRTDSTHFLILDSDVVPPASCVGDFLRMGADVAGGWVPIKGADGVIQDGQEGRPGRWAAGLWVDIDTFANFSFPWVSTGEKTGHEYDDIDLVLDHKTKELSRKPLISHLAPIACLMISRTVLELIEFQDGTDQFCKLAGYDVWTVRNPSLQYGCQLYELGIDCRMSGSVLCQHVA